MKRVTKQSIIKEFQKLVEECNMMHDKLKPVMNSGNMTGGEYWYLLNPMQNYGVKNFYGFDGFKCMLLNEKRFKVWDFQYMLNSLKDLQTNLERRMKDFNL